jgi:hypothetical protein
MANNYDYGIVQGGTGSFGSLQWTDGTADNRKEIFDDSRNIKHVTSVSASSAMQGGASTFGSLKVSDLSSGRVVFAGTSGELEDDADMTFSGDTLTVTKLGAFEAAGAINFANQDMTNVDIDSGAIDGTTIGAASAAAGSFTSLTATSADVNGAADVSSTLYVGGAASFAGALSMTGTLTAKGDVDLGDATSDTITATGRFDSDLVPSTDGARDLGASGLEWKDLYVDGVAYVDSLQADQLGAALDANSQAITNINVDSGAIDGTAIGANSQASGKFTTMTSTGNSSVSGSLHVMGNIDVEGNINSVTKTETTLEVVDKLVIVASGSTSANSDGGGVQFGGYKGSDSVASVLYDHANAAIDFNIGGTTQARLADGAFRPETDNDVDLGASGAEFKDLYIDGVAYVDELQADQLGAHLDANSKNITGAGNVYGSAVSGSATVAGGAATFATAKVSDLTSGRIVIAGASGELADDSDLSFSGDTLTATKIGAFEAAGAINFANQDMTNVDIDSGTIDGATIATSDVTVGAGKTLDVSAGTLTTSDAQKLAIMQGANANVDIGAFDLRASTLTADSATQGRVAIYGANGVLSEDSDLSFSGDTLTVTKLGAYEQAGAVDFSDEAMTNVNIDSGAIDGTTIGASSQSSVKATTLSGSGAMNVDGNAQFNGTVTGKSSITAGTSFIIGSADLNEADMEKLDGITNGTAAASKALVLDASLNIANIGTVGCGAITSGGISSFYAVSASAGLSGSIVRGGSLALASGATVTGIADEDGMGSNSATLLATQQSIKAYVDAQVTAQDLDFQADSGGALNIDLDSETLSVLGTSNEITTAGSGNTITISLPDDVTIGQDLTVTRNLSVNGNATLGDASGDDITFNGSLASNLAVKTDDSYTIGSSSKKLAAVYANNMYTGDFHMKNERGDWTLFEESDHIRIRNNSTGQEFKLDMTPLA